MRLIALAVLGGLLFTGVAVADEPSTDLAALVPGGAATPRKPGKFNVVTPEKTVIEVEFHSNGTLDEAEGRAATRGDVFVPGGGLLTLAQAVQKAEGPDVVFTGKWEFDHSFSYGWHYEFDILEQGARYEIKVSALDGRILAKKPD